MLNVDIQKLLKNGASRYELVSATAKRARMIVDEAKKNKDIIIEKPVSIAVAELQDDAWSICTKD